VAGLELSQELVDWAAAALGWRPSHVHDASWDHAESAVAQLVADDGRRAYLKTHRQARKHRQERAALEAWAPSLPATPTLWAAREGSPSALLMSACPGARVDAQERPRATLLQVHEAAGAWLQRLHRLPFVDDDPLPLEEAVLARLEGWSRRAAGRLAPETLRWASARVGDADLAGVLRVPCHRDFGPRNWLWDDTAGLCVIDFEHAQPDVWCVDVNRLVDEPWHADPGLEDAFWAGYGRRPDAHERSLGDAMRLLYAVGTVAWGAEHGDAPFEAQGRAVLRRLGAPGCGP
jgi:hypothetical protein